MKTLQSIPVLYAEDNSDDTYFMQRAFKEVGVPNPLISLEDGAQTIQYLEKAASNDVEGKLSPCLLLLDLKLPIKTGFDVLQWVREHPRYYSLSVVVVSASGQHLDIDLAKKLGVSDYIIKPSNPAGLIEIVRKGFQCWLKKSSSHS